MSDVKLHLNVVKPSVLLELQTRNDGTQFLTPETNADLQIRLIK